MFQISLFCFYVVQHFGNRMLQCKLCSWSYWWNGYCIFCASLVLHWIRFVINVSHKKYRFQRHTYIWWQIKIIWIEICFWEVVPLHLHAGLVVKMKFTLLGLVVTPNINISAKDTGYLMHTNKHIFHKMCLFYSKNAVFCVRL